MNKVALITGASSGIGLKTAIEFAKKGYDVVIHYLNHEKEAQDLQKTLENDYHVKTLCIKADLTKENEIKDMIEKINNTYGRLDTLVNNAGIAIDTILEDKTKDNKIW